MVGKASDVYTARDSIMSSAHGLYCTASGSNVGLGRLGS